MNGDNRVDSLPREAEGASDSSENRGLCRTQDGLIWEYIDRAESDFLYHEVFCARLYLREGVTLLDGDIVVDVGANIGLFSLMCLSECPSTRVVAIEPVPQICDVLHRNLHFAKSRVSILRSAAGSLSTEPGAQARLTYFPSRPGESTRHRAEAEDMNRTLRTCATDASNLAKYEFDPSYRVNAPQDSVEVEAPHCTLLDVIRQLSLPCIDLLKVYLKYLLFDVTYMMRIYYTDVSFLLVRWTWRGTSSMFSSAWAATDSMSSDKSSWVGHREKHSIVILIYHSKHSMALFFQRFTTSGIGCEQLPMF
jgi:FkbM family methyltransferase